MLRFVDRLARRSHGRDVYCVLRFPDSTEGRWFDQLPSPGTRIRSQREYPDLSKVWVVDEVLQSGRSTYTVFCVGREEYIARVRQGFEDKPDLATELLEVARRTDQALSELRHRWKHRNYVP